MATVAEQLASVEAAIAAIEGGAQEYKIGWRTVRRAELTALYAERRALRQELATANRVSVAVFDTR
jgi:hypothetical protein